MNISLMEQYGIPISSFLKILAGNKDEMPMPMYTLGAVAIAAFLKQKGITDISVRDFYTDTIDVCNVDITGISSTFLELSHVKEIAEYIKQQNPDTHVVLGGPLCWTVPPEKILAAVQDIDIIVIGEGEKTFFELITSIRSHKPLHRVRGIAYREKNNIIRTPRQRPINLNKLSPPAWNFLDVHKKLKILPVETARGCLYNCVFCSEVHYWGKPVRFRNSEDITREIKNNVASYGITTFRFVDSCFTAPEEHCGQVCDALYTHCIKQGIDIKWTSYARINNLKQDLLIKMKRAGCVALDIGMESGDNNMLKNMKKNYSKSSIIESITAAKETGIITHCNIMIGFPGETEQTINNTIDVLEKAKPDTYGCMLLDVAPHTDIFNNPETYGLKGTRINWEHQTMSSTQAASVMFTLPGKISSSCYFPGGEYFACTLTSLGYSGDEIKDFYKKVIHNPGDKLALMMAGKIFNR